METSDTTPYRYTAEHGWIEEKAALAQKELELSNALNRNIELIEKLRSIRSTWWYKLGKVLRAVS